MKYLFNDVVGIEVDFFFVHKKANNIISIVLDHGKPFVSLVSMLSSSVGTISVVCIFQTYFGLEVL